MRANCISAIFLVLLVGGCNALPPGDPALLVAPTEANASKPAPVILIRGWRDLWSDGIDRLAEKLRAEGIETRVFKDSQAREVGTILEERARRDALNGPVILIGFSYGADDVIDIAARLQAANRTVNLLVLIDPVTPAKIPYSVRRCVNFYQPNGAWDLFPWLRGVAVTSQEWQRGSGSIPPVLLNVNVRQRDDLNSADMSHKTIACNEKVHAAIVKEVRELVRRTSEKQD